MKRTEAPDPIPNAPEPEQLVDLATWVRVLSRRVGLEVRETPADFAGNAPTLYLETTVVSYLTARLSRDVTKARRQLLTKQWWHEHRARHVSYISDLVFDEARCGDPGAARSRLSAIVRLSQVHMSAQSHELAGQISARCRLPERAYADAHHVAIAALNGLDVLLTWNCAHLANPHMIPHIRRACEAYGYAPPVIHTPEELIGVCAYGRSGS
jgi:hypothetical protein